METIEEIREILKSLYKRQLIETSKDAIHDIQNQIDFWETELEYKINR